jgi:hypothetical protein
MPGETRLEMRTLVARRRHCHLGGGRRVAVKFWAWWATKAMGY